MTYPISLIASYGTRFECGLAPTVLAPGTCASDIATDATLGDAALSERRG